MSVTAKHRNPHDNISYKPNKLRFCGVQQLLGMPGYVFYYDDIEIVWTVEKRKREPFWDNMMSYTCPSFKEIPNQLLDGIMLECGFDFELPVHTEAAPCGTFSKIETDGEMIHYFTQSLPDKPLAKKGRKSRVIPITAEGAGIEITPSMTKAFLTYDADQINAFCGSPMKLDQSWARSLVAFAHQCVSKSPFASASERIDSIRWLHDRGLSVVGNV